MMKTEKAATMNPIETAVMPQKDAAIERAAQYAQEVVDRCTKELEAADWDKQVVAPWPSGNLSRAAYSRAQARRSIFDSITKNRDADRTGMRHPEFCDISPALVARFIKEAKEDAAAQYDLFVAKLVGKIGTVTTATLNGSHVWGYSFLTVTKADGTLETWKTQQILNVSCLGKLFNQYPSRKVKA